MMMTKDEIHGKISDLGKNVKWLSPNEPVTSFGIKRLLDMLVREVEELETEQRKIGSGLDISMWSPTMKYSKNDIVMFFKQENKQVNPDVGKREFVFLLLSTKEGNDSIPNYELVDGIPNFSKSNWKLINPTSYLLQDLIGMKEIVKEVFQSLLDEHVKVKHRLANGGKIEQNLVKKDYSNLKGAWELGNFSTVISKKTISNELGIKVIESKDSVGIMECFVEYGYDERANPLDDEILIHDERYYYQNSPIWDESDKNIFAMKYMDQDMFSLSVHQIWKNNTLVSSVDFNNLRYGTNIFHRRITFPTPFLNDEYCVFFDTYGNGEFVFGYDKQDIEGKTLPTYDAIVSQPMIMNKTPSGFDIVLPVHTHFNSLQKYKVGVPWTNKFRFQAIGRYS